VEEILEDADREGGALRYDCSAWRGALRADCPGWHRIPTDKTLLPHVFTAADPCRSKKESEPALAIAGLGVGRDAPRWRSIPAFSQFVLDEFRRALRAHIGHGSKIGVSWRGRGRCGPISKSGPRIEPEGDFAAQRHDGEAEKLRAIRRA